MATLATATITAQDTWTTPVRLGGYFNFSVVAATGTPGTLGGTTVTVQRSTDNSTWRDVDTFTSSAEDVGFDGEILWYRAGVKTGQYVASVIVRLGGEANGMVGG
jgi:hypothetical protein